MSTLDPWGYEPQKKDMHVNGRSDFIQPILFRYPPGHAQAGEPWTPPAGTTAYFLIGVLDGTEQRYNAVISGDSAMVRIESEVADLIPARAPQRFYVSLPGTPNSNEYMLTKGKVVRHD
ncbi:hypothetical protein ACFWQG_12985 [Rhodococcus sp. NPDC058532]|uniref:LtfC-like domain-containing protein n=1 Tax=Rhodococcus sp. NPDC058532 TaxID=3346540 RepID=UPI003655322F